MTEPNLGEAISRAVAAQLNPEFIEAVINKKVTQLITEAVEQSLRSYSDTGKLIQTKVAEALQVNDLDLPSYGHAVSAMLKAQIEAKVSDLISGQLAADMDELLGLAPKEIKLSQIAADMLELHDEGYGEVITVIVGDDKYSSRWIYLHEYEALPESRKHSCMHKLLINSDGRIVSATIDHVDTKRTKTIGRSYGLAQKLRAYVACGTRIIIDEDAVVTSVGDY
ncbi:hypothetical protein [Pannonibacter tanglangensis]|uniref:Uncharacterized protein n=1 Tax=Pannonibacter tanglangensis TaxID=2750084 RepID=A0ABW9ZI72_9HYPH|nr:hypothetical protein [Pannonibacter sp. XCT-34]NBN62819.1 hypothetical protein [Pannonibacter sp. XCT-34]